MPRSRIYVAGGNTLLGRSLIEHLARAGHDNLVGVPPDEPDLTDRNAVHEFFAQTRPEFVFMAAGASGGIKANQDAPADLMLDNLLASTHVLDAAFRSDVAKLLYLGSSCMYPRLAPQPLRATSLGTGPLEPSSAAYATAKLAGLALCQAYRRQHGAPFISAIPANAFGPHDDFSPDSGHVVAALVRRMHEAKVNGQETVEIWGTGASRREFIFAPDLADACVFGMRHFDDAKPINLGGGEEISIAELAGQIADVVGYRGAIHFDRAKPEGAPRKLLDSTALHSLGWQPATKLRVALEITYDWFLKRLHTPCAAKPDEATHARPTL